jgi:hypothetical protein
LRNHFTRFSAKRTTANVRLRRRASQLRLGSKAWKAWVRAFRPFLKGWVAVRRAETDVGEPNFVCSTALFAV